MLAVPGSSCINISSEPASISACLQVNVESYTFDIQLSAFNLKYFRRASTSQVHLHKAS